MNSPETREGALQCPFCGGTDIRFDNHEPVRQTPRTLTNAIHAGDNVWSTCCYQCGATFPNMYSREKLAEKWKRRPPTPAATIEQAARDDDDEAGLVLTMFNALHEGVEGFPIVAMMELSDKQAERGRNAIRAISTALRSRSDLRDLALEEAAAYHDTLAEKAQQSWEDARKEGLDFGNYGNVRALDHHRHATAIRALKATPITAAGDMR